MVSGVTIELDGALVMSDGIISIFDFTLNWGVPFDNFDPIQNYIITIGCTGSECPLTLSNDNVTTTRHVSYTTTMTNVTIMVTASNTVGTSDPAVLEVISK